MLSNNIAAIDMGTNSFHLIIVSVKKNGTFKVLDREREVIRLGANEGKDLSFISKEETGNAIKILLRFKKLAQYYNAKIRAVATSAVREARNKGDFIRYVKDSTGINIEIIDGKHEAALIFLGIKNALNIESKKVLCLDIGGGSSEFIYGNDGKTVFAESIKIGAVRLSKMFFPNFLLTEGTLKKCEKYVEEQIKSDGKINFNADYDLAVGSSGTIQSAAALIYFLRNGRRAKFLNGFHFNKDELYGITNEILSKKTFEERLKINGIEEKRADILPAGLIILNKAFELFKIENLTVSDYALREGIILDTINIYI
jgi:exopolyphosphatase/guanosine-5'-triphosphate,3'-diphosphate pyrophosphatase